MLSPESVVQEKVFTKWANFQLRQSGYKLENVLAGGLDDGTALWHLADALTGSASPKPQLHSKFRIHKVQNIANTLAFFQEKEGLRLSVSGEDILNHNKQAILSLFWELINYFHLKTRRGSKVKYKTHTGSGGSLGAPLGGPDVSRRAAELISWLTIFGCEATNMTSAFFDGKYLCKLVNAISPGKIKEDQPDALTAAIAAAETLGIPRLLEPSEVLSIKDDPIPLLVYITYFRQKIEEKEPRLKSTSNDSSSSSNRIRSKSHFGTPSYDSKPNSKGSNSTLPFPSTQKNLPNLPSPVEKSNVKSDIRKFEEIARRVSDSPKYVRNSSGVNSAIVICGCLPHWGWKSQLRTDAIFGNTFSIQVATIGVSDSVISGGGNNGSRLHGVVTDPDGSIVPSTLVSNGNGSFEVKFTPPEATHYKVSVIFDGKEVEGSPVMVQAVDDAQLLSEHIEALNAISGVYNSVRKTKLDNISMDQLKKFVNSTNEQLKLYLEVLNQSFLGPSVRFIGTPRIVVGELGQFTIAVDNIGKEVLNMVIAYQADVTGVLAVRQEVPVPGACQFNVTFMPTKSGKHSIILSLSNMRTLSGSPLEFSVDPAAIPSVTAAEIPSKIIVGEEARFTLQVADFELPETIKMIVSDQNHNSEVVQDIQVPGPCHFQLAFTPIVSGHHQVELLLSEGTTLQGSPILFFVNEPSIPSARLLEGPPSIIGKEAQISVAVDNIDPSTLHVVIEKQETATNKQLAEQMIEVPGPCEFKLTFLPVSSGTHMIRVYTMSDSGSSTQLAGSPLFFEVLNDDKKPPELPIVALAEDPKAFLGIECELIISVDNIGNELVKVFVHELPATISLESSQLQQEVMIPGPCQFKLCFTPVSVGSHAIDILSSDGRSFSGSPLVFNVQDVHQQNQHAPSQSTTLELPHNPRACLISSSSVKFGQESEFVIEVENVESCKMLVVVRSVLHQQNVVSEEIEIPASCQFKLLFTPLTFKGPHEIELFIVENSNSGGDSGGDNGGDSGGVGIVNKRAVEGSPLLFNVEEDHINSGVGKSVETGIGEGVGTGAVDVLGSGAVVGPVARLVNVALPSIGEEYEVTIEMDNIPGPQLITVVVREATSTKDAILQEVEIPGSCQFKLVFTPSKEGDHVVEISIDNKLISGSPLVFSVGGTTNQNLEKRNTEQKGVTFSELGQIQVIGDPFGTANSPIIWILKLSDTKEQPCIIPVTALSVTITGLYGTHSATISVLDPGSYEVKWTPTTPGEYFITFNILGNTVIKDMVGTVTLPDDHAFVICSSLWHGKLEGMQVVAEEIYAKSKEEFIAKKISLLKQAASMLDSLKKTAISQLEKELKDSTH